MMAGYVKKTMCLSQQDCKLTDGCKVRVCGAVMLPYTVSLAVMQWHRLDNLLSILCFLSLACYFMTLPKFEEEFVRWAVVVLGMVMQVRAVITLKTHRYRHLELILPHSFLVWVHCPKSDFGYI
jgi:uncharacterized protein DUF3522